MEILSTKLNCAKVEVLDSMNFKGGGKSLANERRQIIAPFSGINYPAMRGRPLPVSSSKLFPHDDDEVQVIFPF
jgi:hypothetical protein